MKFVADLHIHSHFSRATSKKLTPEYLAAFAALKGINVVGTGDFTHPGWLSELKEKTFPDGNDFLRLKKEFLKDSVFDSLETRFMLTAEISSIYKKNGKVRKVHNVVLVPSFEEAEKVNRRLLQLGGNLISDGRPILGLDSRDLLEIVLECSEQNYFIPAHIWTPWFSVLGSKSGFDSLKDCFGDLNPYIKTVETGLSTDPPMNWLCSFLDNHTLVSNSDAHSPDKLGRNANVFNTDLSYTHLVGALKSGNPNHFQGTIDMFPQEGKYHYDGHRKCGICWDPAQTLKNNFTCPICKKPVTVGVMNRVIELSDREDIFDRPNRLPFHSIIPLKEIIAEINGVGTGSKKAEEEYLGVIKKLGKELEILIEVPLEEIKKKTSHVLAEAIRRMRNREIYIREGYDGEFGTISVFRRGEAKNFTKSDVLFKTEQIAPPQPRALIEFNLHGIQTLLEQKKTIEKQVAEKREQYTPKKKETNFNDLNAEQFEAVKYTTGASLIIAGPGTGKTNTLTSKIAWLIDNGFAKPREILAITFTNKAAGELNERLHKLVKKVPASNNVVINTFHGFGLEVLKKYHARFKRTKDFVLFDEQFKTALLKSYTGNENQKLKDISLLISSIKSGLHSETDFFVWYEKQLVLFNAFDLDDLISKPIQLFLSHPEILKLFQHRFRYIFVDEYQDTNKAQYQLLRLLAAGQNSILCVVGDENQSIYGFRGASASNIRQFTSDFSDAKIFHLRQSYRCSQTILLASAGVLENNTGFLEGLEKGVRIVINEQQTSAAEAEFIARQIIDLVGGVSFFSIDSSVATGNRNENIQSLADFGILCRTRNQFEALAKALNNHHIPFQEVGTEPFYHQKEFIDVCYLLNAFSQKKYENALPFFSLKKLKISQAEFEYINKKISNGGLTGALELLKEMYFRDQKFEDQNWQRFREIADELKYAADFLRHINLGSGIDTHKKNLEAVSIMTLHASKGLEFECVFIPGCEDGLIPYKLYNRNSDIEEEKRLLYVGMTRAKKLLYLSHAKSRTFRGRKFNLSKSPFLNSIQEELLEKVKNNFHKKPDEKDNQLSLF